MQDKKMLQFLHVSDDYTNCVWNNTHKTFNSVLQSKTRLPWFNISMLSKTHAAPSKVKTFIQTYLESHKVTYLVLLKMLLILRRIRGLLGFTCFDNDIVLVEKSSHSVTRALRRN